MTGDMLGTWSTVAPILDTQEATLDSDQEVIAKVHDISLDGTMVKTITRVVSTASPRIPVAQTTTLQPAITEAELTASETEMVVRIMTREEIRRELYALEQRYGMTSENFYDLWQAGKSHVVGIDRLRWVAFWEAWRERYQLPTVP
jgi:hypothetical protein